MAQVISTLCDECLASGTEEPGEAYAVSVEVPGSKATPYVIDTCETHAKPIRDLLAALSEYGRRTDRKAPMPLGAGAVLVKQPSERGRGPADRTPGACPVCGNVSPGRSAMVSHVRRVHGKSIAEVEGQDAIDCPRGCGGKVGQRSQALSAHYRGSVHAMGTEEARAAVAEDRAALASARE